MSAHREAADPEAAGIPTVHRLDDLVDLVESEPALYIRWSRGPGYDVGSTSRDELTGVPLPGLSASPLAVEDWWGDRSLRMWVARRLYDYRHLREQRGPGVRPWVLKGHEVGRGPDNEPLVACDEPLAWLDDAVVEEGVRLVEAQPAPWGSLRRD